MNDLFRLVREGDSRIIGMLNSENISQQNSEGVSLLHEAIAYKQNSIALELINKGIDLNLQDRQGRTALHYAASYLNKEVTENLVRYGADVNIIDKHGNGALWTAVSSARKDYGLFEFILKSGGNPLTKNIHGLSCVDCAIKNNSAALKTILKKYMED